MSTPTKTLRLSEQAHTRAAELAEMLGESMTTAVSDAIEEAYQKAFWASAARQVERMKRDNPQEWEAYRAEALELDAMGSDGLDEYEIPETLEPVA